jgi:hypothetical protein
MFYLCLIFQDVMLIHLELFLGFIQMRFVFQNKKYLFLNNIVGVFGLT